MNGYIGCSSTQVMQIAKSRVSDDINRANRCRAIRSTRTTTSGEVGTRSTRRSWWRPWRTPQPSVVEIP